MKSIALILAVSLFSFAGLKANTSLTTPPTAMIQQDDKVEIKAEDIPQVVQDKIAETDEVRSLSITKAYRAVSATGTTQYLIVFDNSGEKLKKMYDAEGNEVEIIKKEEVEVIETQF